MRVGIIGGGFGLNVQAPIIKSHPSIELIAVCTMTRHQIPEEMMIGQKPPIHYKNWRDLIDTETLDLLFVSSMPIEHFQMVEYAIRKGMHVVCEKPFTMNSQQSGELLRLAREHDIKVIIDFEWRYLPIRKKAKEIIMQNEVGDILHFEYHISSAQYQRLLSHSSGWMGDKQKGGGMLGALGSHMIDCLRWIAQDEIQFVNGFVHTHVVAGGGEKRDADDAFFMHGRLQRGSTFSIQLLSGVNHGFGSQLKVFGTSGTVAIVDDRKLLFGKADMALEEVKVESSGVVPPHLSNEAKAYFPAFYPFLKSVYRFITANKEDADLPTITDGHENQVIIDKVMNDFSAVKYE
ncbi:MAG: Gfo/Idh/MocA family protein [Lysinibacillus sp.]